MSKLNLDAHSKVVWPQRCAVCGAPAQYKARASQTRATGFYFVVYTQQTHALQYPVCRKHRFLCALLDLPARWGFVGSFLAFVFVPTMIWILLILGVSLLTGLKGDSLNSYLTVTAVLAYGGMIGFFVYATKRKPVKIHAADKNTITLDILNERYALEFRQLNASVR